MDADPRIPNTHVRGKIARQTRSYVYVFHSGMFWVAVLTIFITAILYHQLWQVDNLLGEHTIVSYSKDGFDTTQQKGDTNLYNPENEHRIKISEKSNDNLNTHVREFRENAYDVQSVYESRRYGADHESRTEKNLDRSRGTDKLEPRFTRPAWNISNPVITRGTRISNHFIPRESRVSKSYTSRVSLGTDLRESSIPRVSRVNVLILAYHRSGSSFLGEMFNQNPKAFYLFEPLHSLQISFGPSYKSPLLRDTITRDLLSTIFTCSFNKHPLFVRTLSSTGFRLRSRTVTSKFCDPRVTSGKMHLCRTLNASLLTQLCRSSPLTVIKTIRMNNWENINFLIEPDSTTRIPLKVIYLVRDPRAIIASRVSWFLRDISDLWLKNVTHDEYNATRKKNAMSQHIRTLSINMCGQMEGDINNWKKMSKLSNIIAMVRYEDAAKRPLDIYNAIYEFAGAAKSYEVEAWLEANTKTNSDPYYYSTTRNSTATAQMWRLRLPMELVAVVQEHCSKVLSMLGYRLVKSDEELRKISRSLVISWHDNQLLRTNYPLRV